jgi:hypothetical protein
MGEDERILVAFLCDEAVSQPPDTGTGIDDNDIVIPGADLQTRRIPPIAQILSARDRD